MLQCSNTLKLYLKSDETHTHTYKSVFFLVCGSDGAEEKEEPVEDLLKPGHLTRLLEAELEAEVEALSVGSVSVAVTKLLGCVRRHRDSCPPSQLQVPAERCNRQETERLIRIICCVWFLMPIWFWYQMELVSRFCWCPDPCASCVPGGEPGLQGAGPVPAPAGGLFRPGPLLPLCVARSPQKHRQAAVCAVQHLHPAGPEGAVGPVCDGAFSQ